MISTGPEDLRAVGDPLAAALLPGWRITWAWCAPEDIGGALAMIFPDPKRSMAVIKVAPHPVGEDVGESIAHELVHGAISPLTEGRNSAADIMIEEPIVERIGVLLARLWQSAPAMARAMARSIATYAPTRARQKITALAPRARSGGNMDPIDLILAAVEAAAAADDPKQAIADLLAKVKGIKSGLGTEPDGDEGVNPMGKEPMDKPAPAGGGAAMGGDMRARKALAEEQARARIAREELEAIAADGRAVAKTQIVDNLRARLPADHPGLPALEKRVMAAPNYAAAKLIAEVALEAIGPEQTPQARARGAERGGAAPGLGGAKPPPDPEDLKSFDAGFQSEWRRLAAGDPLAADVWLKAGRARMSRDAHRTGKGN